MPNISTRQPLVRAVVIAAALALVAMLSLPAQIDARTNVPFRAFETNVGSAVPIGDCGPDTVRLLGHGTGTGTQLGRYEIEYVECLDLVTFDFTVDFTITAADGSTLAGDYAGAVPTADTYVADGEFTGGTGRFSNASGEFEISATFDASGYEAWWRGWSSNPGERAG